MSLGLTQRMYFRCEAFRMVSKSFSCFWNLLQTVVRIADEERGGKREAIKGEEDEETSSYLRISSKRWNNK